MDVIPLASFSSFTQSRVGLKDKSPLNVWWEVKGWREREFGKQLP